MTWTPELIQTVKRLAAERTSPGVIAAMVGKTAAACQGLRKRLGLPPSNYREEWPPEKIEHLKRLLAKGLSSSQIAKELGVTKNAVIGKTHRLKLKFARKPSAPLKPKRKPKVTRLAEPRTPTGVTGPVEPSALPALPPLRQMSHARPTQVTDADYYPMPLACRRPRGHPLLRHQSARSAPVL